MTNFFIILKTVLVHFWSIFPILGAKNSFLENQVLSHIISYGVLALCQNLEKTDNTFPRKRLDRRKDGRKDGRRQNDGRTDRPYFIRSFSANASGPTRDPRKQRIDGVYAFNTSRCHKKNVNHKK